MGDYQDHFNDGYRGTNQPAPWSGVLPQMAWQAGKQQRDQAFPASKPSVPIIRYNPGGSGSGGGYSVGSLLSVLEGIGIGIWAGWTLAVRVYAVASPSAALLVCPVVGFGAFFLAMFVYIKTMLNAPRVIFFPIALCTVLAWTYIGYRIGVWAFPFKESWQLACGGLGFVLASLDKWKLRSDM
jgi:hypothetical protein